jgi:hypothetical protein
MPDGGTDGEIGADFLFAERVPHVDVATPLLSARRTWAMSQAFSDSLPQSNPSSVWTSASRADANLVQRRVKTARLRAAAASRGALSAASSQDISLSNCSACRVNGSRGVTSSR